MRFNHSSKLCSATRLARLLYFTVLTAIGADQFLPTNCNKHCRMVCVQYTTYILRCLNSLNRTRLYTYNPSYKPKTFTFVWKLKYLFLSLCISFFQHEACEITTVKCVNLAEVINRCKSQNRYNNCDSNFSTANFCKHLDKVNVFKLPGK
jgi:hypothetical protein